MFDDTIVIGTAIKDLNIFEATYFSQFRIVAAIYDLNYDDPTFYVQPTNVEVPCQIYKSLEDYYIKVEFDESLFIVDKRSLRLDGLMMINKEWLEGIIVINNENSFNYDGVQYDWITRSKFKPGYNYLCIGSKFKIKQMNYNTNSVLQYKNLINYE